MLIHKNATPGSVVFQLGWDSSATSIFGCFLRHHPEGTIQANGFTIQQRILDNRLHQLGEFLGVAQTLWERHRLGQEVTHLLGQRRQHRSVKETGSNRYDTNALRAEISGDRKSHTDYGCFAGRVGCLADLTVVGGDRSGVHDNATLTVGVRFVLADQTSRQPNNVERSDRVDGQHSSEIFQSVRKFLVEVERLEGDGRSGTVNGNIESSERALGRFERSGNVRFRCDISRHKDGLVAQLLGQLVAVGLGQIDDHDSTAALPETLDGGSAQTGCSTGYQANGVLEWRWHMFQDHCG